MFSQGLCDYLSTMLSTITQGLGTMVGTMPYIYTRALIYRITERDSVNRILFCIATLIDPAALVQDSRL